MIIIKKSVYKYGEAGKILEAMPIGPPGFIGCHLMCV